MEQSQSDASDADVIARTKNGDQGARDSLARKARQSAFVFALQLTGDPHRSQDVAQDSVVRFLGSLDRFDANRPMEPWLFQIVRNRLRDLFRSDRVRATEPLELASGEERREVVDESADPLGLVLRTELQRHIWTEMASLGVAHREIIVLRDHHGLSYREIATTLGIPEGTVMSRLHSARTALRARLVAAEEFNAQGGADR